MSEKSAETPRYERAPEMLFESRFPARPDRLKLVRDSVRSAALMCGFDDRTAEDIVLAVDEACQNVIVHGYRERIDGEIVLTLLRGADDALLVRLWDFAPSVDPAAIKPRALTDVRPGKLGTHFIQTIMDSAEYRPNPHGGGNLLQMVKRARITQC